jgi:hypothetical protein
LEPPRFLDREKLPILLSQAQERLADYGIGFVRIERRGVEDDAMLAGSGTLIRVDSIHAILTADHVVTNLPRTGKVGLVLNLRPDSRLHRFLVDMETVKPIQIGKASNDATGPDLAALVLPPSTVGELLARTSFYDLPRRQSQMLFSPPPLEHGGWVLYGFVEEWSSSQAGESGFSTVKYFTSICGGAVVTSEEQRGDFDYFNFRVKYGATYKGPQSFAGVSGGALWQVFARIDGDAVDMADPLLSGVAFFQTAIDDDGRTIVCHGRRSIYDSVVAMLRTAS